VARWRFAVGEFFETLTKPEMVDALREDRAAARAEAEQRAAAHARKYGRLNPPVRGIASGSVLQMGGDYPNSGPGGGLVQPPQPRAGYAWAVRRASVSGLTSGTTPDIVNLHRKTPHGVAATSAGVWQFNGNNYAYTFSHEQLVFLEGETPVLVSVGTFAATGTITFDMDFIEVPEVELYRAR
jgi:hypothetical protein